MKITGGDIGTVNNGDPAMIEIYGGNFSGSIINDDPTESIVDNFGSNFSLTDPKINGADTDRTLTGDLMDGTPFETEYVELGNDTNTVQGLAFNGTATAPGPGVLSSITRRGAFAF